MRRSQAPSQVAKRARTSTTVRSRTAPSRNKSRVSLITRQPRGFNAGFPPQLRLRHKYVEAEITFASTTGSVASYLFSCNGMYDPNITSTGHQPVYFDQTSAIYNHYTVVRSFIRVKFTHGSGASPYLLGLAIDDDTSPASTVNTFAEQSTATMTPVNGGITTPYTVLTKSWDAVKYFGPNPMANDSLQGSGSANPSEQSYYAIQLKAQGAGSISGQLTVEIWYDAIWDELTTVAGS